MCKILVFLLCVGCSLANNVECFTRGQRGTCQPIGMCPSAINLLSRGEIDFCDFEGFEPHLCCPGFSRPHRPFPIPPNSRHRPHDSHRRPPPPPQFRHAEERRIPYVTTPKLDYLLSSIDDDVTTATSPNYVTPLPVANGVPISMKKCMEYYPVYSQILFITGGTKSLPKQFPHMALIGYGSKNDKQWLCGGSLISLNFILTAAHCLRSSTNGDAQWVHLGDLDLSTEDDDAQPQDFEINKIIPHPNYKYPLKYHDIALIQLDRNITPTAYVSPACLQTIKTINETKMSASGWGRTDFAGDASSFLLNLDLNEVDSQECTKFYNDVSKDYLPNGIIEDFMICAGGVVGEDTCDGDSGGPLQVENTYRSGLRKVSTVVGITSFGKACGLTKSPGVYTRISYYTSWIESIVWPEEYINLQSTVKPQTVSTRIPNFEQYVDL